jgi:hypothetical protein
MRETQEKYVIGKKNGCNPNRSVMNAIESSDGLRRIGP